MATDLIDHHEVRKLLTDAIDTALVQGNWESSLLFKNMHKRLLAMRAFVVEQLTEAAPAEETLLEKVDDDAFWLENGYQPVYLALYQTDGHKLNNWNGALASLKNYCVSRPAYIQEEHVSELVRSKRSRNEAYIKVWVKSEDVVTTTAMIDRFGHEVITIKENSARAENIIKFYHDNEEYRFKENQLILQEKSQQKGLSSATPSWMKKSAAGG
ncbi:MAG: Dot/Icm secretion system protein IcmQ [Gammaproteobacteria bacterium]